VVAKVTIHQLYGPPWATSTSTATAICPDLLSITDLGSADGWRGRIVRVFFHLLRRCTGV
jgi:hypothetical protein